jgi:hypothetical protein
MLSLDDDGLDRVTPEAMGSFIMQIPISLSQERESSDKGGRGMIDEA